MTRETRFNLIVLISLLVLSAPGAVILFLKKLDPTASPMYLPHPVHGKRAFNDPAALPPIVPRVVPPRTRAWLATLPEGGAPGDRLLLAPVELALSRDRRLQVLSIARRGPSTEVLLVDWAPASSPSTPSEVRLELASGEIRPTSLERSTRLPVPEPVRRELQRLGFLAPPREIRTLRTGCSPSISPDSVVTVLANTRVSGFNRIRVPGRSSGPSASGPSPDASSDRACPPRPGP